MKKLIVLAVLMTVMLAGCPAMTGTTPQIPTVKVGDDVKVMFTAVSWEGTVTQVDGTWIAAVREYDHGGTEWADLSKATTVLIRQQ